MFLDTQEKDLVLVLAVLFFAAVHARSNEKVPVIEGIRSVAASAGLAFLLGWLLFAYAPRLLTPAVVAISSVAAFMGTSLQLAIVKHGNRILTNPDALFKAVLPPFLAKIFSPADDSAQPTNQS
ncbi:hypothetical protein A6C57_23490 [Fibrella sp. ES10-3-2-2]|nr:hypothetical protein A6C57_23490 [Fibrella sp. ES10-3-2-2]